MRRVLVVGGAGYIGCCCARELADHGDEVVVLDDLSTGHAEAVDGELVVGDVRDRGLLREVLSAGRFDAVLHFAAQALVGESVAHPLATFDRNVGGTLALLAEMQVAGVTALVFSSTCAVYGDPAYLPLDEAHPKAPVSPYGRSKWMAEQVLAAARERDGLRSAALRYFNAAGAWPDGSLGESHAPETHLIPLALDAATGRRGALSVFGRDWSTRDGTCERDYIHVADLARAHRLAVERLLEGHPGGAWNLGTGRGTTVLEVIEAVERVTGRPVPRRDAPRRDGDAEGLYASPEAARRELGWTAEHAGIDAIVADAWRWARSPRF